MGGAWLLQMNSVAPKKNKRRSTNTGRDFVLWTLLVHGRDTTELSDREQTEQNRRILSICRKICSTLTDEEYETLKNINRKETERAESLVEEYKIKED